MKRILMAIIMAAVFAGCGNPDEENGGGSTPTPTPTATPMIQLWMQLTWNTDADLDLHLVEEGGTLDGQGDCRPNDTSLGCYFEYPDWTNKIENLKHDDLLPGIYHFYVTGGQDGVQVDPSVRIWVVTYGSNGEPATTEQTFYMERDGATDSTSDDGWVGVQLWHVGALSWPSGAVGVIDVTGDYPVQ